MKTRGLDHTKFWRLLNNYGSTTLGCVKTSTALLRKVNIGQLKRYNKDEADSTTERPQDTVCKY